MAEERRPWVLEGFLDRLDAWISLESPDQDIILVVSAWILTRYDDPYQGMRREPGFPNLWYGKVPLTTDRSGRAVVCAYFVEERRRALRCDSFATLNLPL